MGTNYDGIHEIRGTGQILFKPKFASKVSLQIRNWEIVGMDFRDWTEEARVHRDTQNTNMQDAIACKLQTKLEAVKNEGYVIRIFFVSLSLRFSPKFLTSHHKMTRGADDCVRLKFQGIDYKLHGLHAAKIRHCIVIQWLLENGYLEEKETVKNYLFYLSETFI